jgi:hypothetical protein
MTLDKKVEAGLWFVAAAMHYNVANLNKFQEMVHAKRWSNRKNLDRHFGILHSQ